MVIHIANRNVALTDAQTDGIEHKLQLALGQFGSEVQSARMTLTDVDGPRRGTDVLCRLKLTIHGRGEILVGDTEASVEAAVANVVNRAARSLARMLDLHRNQTNAESSNL